MGQSLGSTISCVTWGKELNSLNFSCCIRFSVASSEKNFNYSQQNICSKNARAHLMDGRPKDQAQRTGRGQRQSRKARDQGHAGLYLATLPLMNVTIPYCPCSLGSFAYDSEESSQWARPIPHASFLQGPWQFQSWNPPKNHVHLRKFPKWRLGWN